MGAIRFIRCTECHIDIKVGPVIQFEATDEELQDTFPDYAGLVGHGFGGKTPMYLPEDENHPCFLNHPQSLETRRQRVHPGPLGFYPKPGDVC